MRRSLWLLAPLALLGGWACNSKSTGFAVVSIRPMWGWDDACNTVTLMGHGFGDDTSALKAKMGDADMAIVGSSERALDQGFVLYAQVPPQAVGSFYDVSLTKGDQSDMIPQGYYYVECPRVLAETLTGGEAVTAGSSITVTGCNLDPAAVSVVVGTAPAVPLTSTCGEGIVTFAAPDLPAGEHHVSFVDATGAVVYPLTLCDDTAVDTACVPDNDFVLTYGGAR